MDIIPMMVDKLRVNNACRIFINSENQVSCNHVSRY